MKKEQTKLSKEHFDFIVENGLVLLDNEQIKWFGENSFNTKNWYFCLGTNTMGASDSFELSKRSRYTTTPTILIAVKLKDFMSSDVPKTKIILDSCFPSLIQEAKARYNQTLKNLGE